MKNDQTPMPDLTRIRPYGDTLDDGRIQLSFTLPVPSDDRAVEAAKEVLHLLGLKNLSSPGMRRLTMDLRTSSAMAASTKALIIRRLWYMKPTSRA